MAHTLILVRHAKSDWSEPVGDRDRPLAPRGRRQAPATGTWLAEHLPPPDLAVVSVATRARQTWKLLEAEFPGAVQVQFDDAVYTFSGAALGGVIAALPPAIRTALLVGHNPALEELLEHLTATETRIPTSALAVVDLPHWDAPAGHLRALGRPADGPVPLAPAHP